MFTAALEELFEHPVHGEHSGPAVHTHATDFALMHFATRLVLCLEDIDLPACRGEFDGGGETARTGTNNDRSSRHQVVWMRRGGAITARWW